MKTSRIVSLVLVALLAATTMLPAQDAARARLWDVVNEVRSIQIATPQDALLSELNASLNTTYVPYGETGAPGLANQVAEESNAAQQGMQSCGAPDNSASWDLVAKTLEDGFDWKVLSLSDLPEALREMSHEERNAFIEAKRAERERIQLEIQQASAERETFMQQALAERLSDAGLGEAMRKVIREQAKANPDDTRAATLLPTIARSKGMNYATVQMTGEPDTPIGGDLPTAWTSKTADMGEVWIELDYATAVTPEQVRIHETFNPGTVKTVLAKDRGGWSLLWSGTAPEGQAPRWFEPPLESVSLRTHTIRIVLDTNLQNGWNEIDAVELTGDGTRQWAHKARASSSWADE